MTKTNITLTNEQFIAILINLSSSQRIIKTTHPADNLLFLYLENGVSVKISGHWEHQSNNQTVVSSIIENESIDDNFNRLENLAENLSTEMPVIKNVSLSTESTLSPIVTIDCLDNSSLRIGVYKTQNNEDEFLSIDFSSPDDTTHYHLDYIDNEWQQTFLFKK